MSKSKNVSLPLPRAGGGRKLFVVLLLVVVVALVVRDPQGSAVFVRSVGRGVSTAFGSLSTFLHSL
jgi:hypothetical protein